MVFAILKYGGILIAVATIVIIGSQIYNARLWIDCYPEKIQKAVPKRTEKEKILKFVLGWPFIFALITMPILAALEIIEIQQDSSFINIFLVTFGVGFLFNLYDLLILDWLIFCFITP